MHICIHTNRQRIARGAYLINIHSMQDHSCASKCPLQVHARAQIRIALYCMPHICIHTRTNH